LALVIAPFASAAAQNAIDEPDAAQLAAMTVAVI